MMDTSEDWSENIVESLLKLIQQRYGYNAYRIDSYDDYQFAYANNISEFDKETIHNKGVWLDKYVGKEYIDERIYIPNTKHKES